MLSLTEKQCEYVADALRSAGFEIPDEWDNDDISKLAESVLGALGVELAQ